VRFVADKDDEMRTTAKPQVCVATSEYLGPFLLHSDFIVISDHENFSHWTVEERGVSHISEVKTWGRGKK
jgi:hypothetical protein